MFQEQVKYFHTLLSHQILYELLLNKFDHALSDQIKLYLKMVLFLRCLSACKTKSYDSTRVKEFCFEKDNRISLELSFFFKSKIL